MEQEIDLNLFKYAIRGKKLIVSRKKNHCKEKTHFVMEPNRVMNDFLTESEI